MRVRAKNIAIDPVYWHYGVKWPLGQVMEYDLSDGECAAIQIDPRFKVESAAPVVGPDSSAVLDPDRKRKVK